MKRRSPLLESSRARYPDLKIGVIGDMEIVTDSPFEPDQSFICDFSALRKRLIVGRSAASWLAEHTGGSPDAMFECSFSESGAIAARIHREQFVLIDEPDSVRYDELFTFPTGRHGEALLLEYECADIVLGGSRVQEVMDELCPMPMLEQPALTWCATRMAHTDIVILPFDQPARHYRILVTPADARFIYDIFSEAIEDADGTQIGFNQYWRKFINGE